MKLCFRSISGKFYSKTFSLNSSVQDACIFLSKQIHSPQQLVFLNRPKHRFYTSNIKLKIVNKENPKFVIFTQFEQLKENNISQPLIGNKNDYFFKKAIPINNFHLIHEVELNEKLLYSKYAYVLNNTPDDLKERINEVAQLGYDVRDCEESLREADFNVSLAIQILVSKNSGNVSDQFYTNAAFFPIDEDDDLYDISSDVSLEINSNELAHFDEKYKISSSSSNFSISSILSNIEEEEEDKMKENESFQNQTKIFRRQNIPKSIRNKFHYHLTLRRKPPSKIKKFKNREFSNL